MPDASKTNFKAPVAPTPAEVQLRHLKAQQKSLESKLDRVKTFHPDMQAMSQSLTEKRLSDVKKQIAKLTK